MNAEEVDGKQGFVSRKRGRYDPENQLGIYLQRSEAVSGLAGVSAGGGKSPLLSPRPRMAAPGWLDNGFHGATSPLDNFQRLVPLQPVQVNLNLSCEPLLP